MRSLLSQLYSYLIYKINTPTHTHISTHTHTHTYLHLQYTHAHSYTHMHLRIYRPTLYNKFYLQLTWLLNTTFYCDPLVYILQAPDLNCLAIHFRSQPWQQSDHWFLIHGIADINGPQTPWYMGPWQYPSWTVIV